MNPLLKLSSIFFALIVLSSSCDEKRPVTVDASSVNNTATASGERDTTTLPDMVFVQDTFDFGTIAEGAVVAHGFEFKNIGKGNLNIISATGSCGCTVPEWPKKPIAPGELGVINVKFNSAGKPNQQIKEVTVHTDCEPTVRRIFIKGFVTPKTSN